MASRPIMAAHHFFSLLLARNGSKSSSYGPANPPLRNLLVRQRVALTATTNATIKAPRMRARRRIETGSPARPSTVEEDALDVYRRNVERRVDAWIAGASDEDLEPFFEHVVALFAGGISPAKCALRWLEIASKDGRDTVDDAVATSAACARCED